MPHDDSHKGVPTRKKMESVPAPKKKYSPAESAKVTATLQGKVIEGGSKVIEAIGSRAKKKSTRVWDD